MARPPDLVISGPCMTVRSAWKDVFEHLANEVDNEYAIIDSTLVR